MQFETSEKKPGLIEINSEADLFPVLYKSYELSQGSYPLQQMLLAEAGAHLAIKEDLITDDSKISITKKFLERIGVGVDSIDSDDTSDIQTFKPARAEIHKQITPQTVSDEFFRLPGYLDILNNNSSEKKGTHNPDNTRDNLHSIVQNIWDRDFYFLQRIDGRPNRKRVSDQWNSAGVTNLIRQQSTGSKVFDEVYRDIQKLGAVVNLRKAFTSHGSFHPLRASVEIYNKHHPDDPVTDEDLREYVYGNGG